VRRAAGRLLAALAALAGLALAPAWAQPPAASARLFPVAGQDANGTATLAQDAGRLVIELRLGGLPAGRPFSLHLEDRGRCYTGRPAAEGAVDAVVVNRPELRADAHGSAAQRIVLEGATLTDRLQNFVRYPIGVYTAGPGGVALACGNASLNRVVTLTMPAPAPSPREQALACIASEDRIVALSRRGDVDVAAIAAAPDASARNALRDDAARHDAEMQDALRAHTRSCANAQVAPADRAAILAEHAASRPAP